MTKDKVSLEDKFDLAVSDVLLTGTEAVVRLALMQHASDQAEGLNTGGYISGYRGSPIAGLETHIARARRHLDQANIHFQAGLNEDLAATALWGSQQAELRGRGRFEGVFGIWYGKGPGVDRSGDALRHANHAGTSPHGGVLALMGDDHMYESSTSAHQSEFAFIDAMIPVLNPASVQDILDLGRLGFALSRYAGLWVGLKCVKDNVESTATVDGSPSRIIPCLPANDERPPGGLNIRLEDSVLDKEARLHQHKLKAAQAFARANCLDKIIFQGGPAPSLGIATTGKSYLDVIQALEELHIDQMRAQEVGLRLYKIALVWPLEPQGVSLFAAGLELIMVVEEKRALIEDQLKQELYGRHDGPAIIGKKDEGGELLFPSSGVLEPTQIAIEIAKRLLVRREDRALRERLDILVTLQEEALKGPEQATRIPYFCAGCPHNSSTVIPEEARAYAGIGCHYMVQWMGRGTEGFTQMGGEGANWIGEAPFSKDPHVFQNIGDGTYIHSGSLAIRAAIAAGTHITFKILYNEAVAMTGGQALDGGLTASDMARQVSAEGAGRVVIVSDEPEKYATCQKLPTGVTAHHRRDLIAVQEELQTFKGVSVVIYEQTCAAEKRRRRKRDLMPDPLKRAFIHRDICEGCGDCGVQSNCVAILPVETDFGRKRMIDQYACNKDFSCLEGFCPSFVTVHQGRLKSPDMSARQELIEVALRDLSDPHEPSLSQPFSMVLTGIGGTGVVTASALIGQAAHSEGKGFGSIDMTGLAQKGGAVFSHIRIAADRKNLGAIRAHRAGADLILGGDLVSATSAAMIELIRRGKTHAVVTSHGRITAHFTHDPDFQLPVKDLLKTLERATGKDFLRTIDADFYATKCLGDSIATNIFLLGFAYQLGRLPVGAKALERAIELNGASVQMNRSAFRYGRLAADDRRRFDKLMGVEDEAHLYSPPSFEESVAERAHFLTNYQNAAYTRGYTNRISRISEIEHKYTPERHALRDAVTAGYFKLLAYKDEYEVARLFTHEAFSKQLAEQFEVGYKLEFHLAPPLFARKDKRTGRPLKRSFGPWMMWVFKALAKCKVLRGTPFDPFGYMKDRRLERALIVDYEKSLDEIALALALTGRGDLEERYEAAVELASLPQKMVGFGPVKRGNIKVARMRQNELMTILKGDGKNDITTG